MEIKMINIKTKELPLKQISEFKNFQGNLKKLSKKNLEKLKNNIKNNGFISPIFIWENQILDGHVRIKAVEGLISEGWQLNSGLPYVEINAANKKDAAKYVLAYNSQFGEITKDGFLEFADNFELNLDEIKLEIDLDIDIESVIGHNRLKELKDVEPEDPENVECTVQKGDVYKLGEHRLMCGDCTLSEDVGLLVLDEVPILMVTDPPYGVNYDPSWRNKTNLSSGIKRPTKAEGKVLNDDQFDWSKAYKLFKGDIIYVWHAGKYASKVQDSIEKIGFQIISQLIWAKPHFILSRGDYHWKHEPCWYAVREGKKHNWQGERDQTTVWEIAGMNCFGKSIKEGDEQTGHGTQKPIECMAKPIQNNTKEKDYVYDPFGGSGTTLIAAEQLTRKCLMMELDPNYCQIIINRWEKLTKKVAVKLTK